MGEGRESRVQGAHEIITVTVVMPVYNGREFVDEQIASVLAQRMSSVDLRFVVLDDCSPDGSYEYLLKNYGSVSNITILKNEVNLGVVKSIEKLLGMIDTEFFCLADQDDVWDANKIQLSIDYLKHSGASLVYTDLKVVDGDLNLIHPSMWEFSNVSAVSGTDIVPLIVKNSVTGCTILGNREILGRALPFPDGVAMHDRWLALMAMSYGGIAALREPLVCYRQHGGNQLGVSSFSVFGFVKRVEKFGSGSMAAYIYRRDRERCGFIDALSSRIPANGEFVFLRAFYSSSSLNRLLHVITYLSVMLKRRKTIGVKNIAADLVTSVLFGKKG